jgi:hypothetical protein
MEDRMEVDPIVVKQSGSEGTLQIRLHALVVINIADHWTRNAVSELLTL